MNLDQLSYVVAIASTGSLSAASKQLGVSQPALSKYLRELEQKVGMELFFRNKRRYFPTPAGRVYLRTAHHILELRQHTRASVAALGASHSGTLRIGVTPNHGIATMAELYPDFDKRYPQIELDIRESPGGELRQLLRLGELDGIFISIHGAVPEGTQALPFYHEELVLAVPSFRSAAAHHSSVLEELPFADLHDYEDSVFILPGPSIALNSLVQAMFQESDFHPQVTTSAPNILIPVAMIRSGTRVGILPSHYVGPDPEIAFFRLRNSPQITVSYLTSDQHEYTQAERYLIFLFIKHSIRSNQKLLWSPELRSILWEFDPIEAANQRLEGPNGH